MTTPTVFKQWRQAFYRQGSPEMARLLREQPLIKEKYLQAYQLVQKSVFNNRATLIIAYMSNKVTFMLWVERNTHAKRNYNKRYGGLLNDLSTKIQNDYKFNIV